MKLETGIVLSKGFAHIVAGVFLPWTAALAQWIGDGTWPSKIVWVGVILPASALGGANAWIAFVSGSWADYMKQRNGVEQPQQPIQKP